MIPGPGKPFDDQDRLIVRLDQVARSDDLYEKLSNTERDLIIKDVSAEKCGWDISAYKPGHPDRHIEVKGRAKGQGTITVTRNEIMYALNQEGKFWLAVVLVDEKDNAEGPNYVYKPFNAKPDWGVASLNYDVQELLGTGAAL